MSTNITIIASRSVTFDLPRDTRGHDTQKIVFNAWQTPTRVTQEILASADPLQAYRDHVLGLRRVEIMSVYADDDLFQERAPIGTEEYCAADEHLEALDAWLDTSHAAGYTVTVDCI